MHPILHYLHGQTLGFMRAGKDLQKAESVADRGASKSFASALFLTGITLTVAPWFLDFLPPRVALRSLVVAMMVFGLAVKYWRGGSVFHLMRDTMRNWIPFGLLIYMYFTMGKMAIGLFKEGEIPGDFPIHGGIMMMSGAFLAFVTSLVQADKASEAAKAEGKTARAAVFGYRFYALIWLTFFIGGFVMLAWGTGWADWFVVDVLGW